MARNMNINRELELVKNLKTSVTLSFTTIMCRNFKNATSAKFYVTILKYKQINYY